MRALKTATLVVAFATVCPGMVVAETAAGAAAGALAGGLLGGPIGAVIGGFAGAAAGSAADSGQAAGQWVVRQPSNGRVIERTCLVDQYGNQTCREFVR